MGRQFLIALGQRDCDLGVSISVTPAGYGGKVSVAKMWIGWLG
jgi:putative transposon-encoded protein